MLEQEATDEVLGDPRALDAARVIGILDDDDGGGLVVRLQLASGETIHMRRATLAGAGDMPTAGVIDAVAAEGHLWELRGPFGSITVPASPAIEVLDRGLVDADADPEASALIDEVLGQPEASVHIWIEGDGIRVATQLTVSGASGVQIVDDDLIDDDVASTTPFRADDLVNRIFDCAGLLGQASETPTAGGEAAPPRVVRVLVTRPDGAGHMTGGTLSWIDARTGVLRVIDRVETTPDGLALHGTERAVSDVARELAGYLAEPIPTDVSA